MSKPTKEIEGRKNLLEALHGAGGKAVPKHLFQQHLTALTRGLQSQLREKRALAKPAAQARSRTTRSMPGSASPRVAGAADGFRGLSERAKRKLAVPVLPVQLGGILAGTYTLRVTPPYDLASTDTSIGFGSPALSATAGRNSGQMSCFVVSDVAAASGGTAMATLGVLFTPRFSPAILSASANPAISFFWWVNAQPTPQCHAADSRASVLFGIISVKGLSVDGESEQDLPLWDEPITFCEENNFDFGTRQSSLSAQMDVDSSHSYIVFLTCFSSALADSWPGSRAVANLAVTLPSITLDVRAIPILE